MDKYSVDQTKLDSDKEASDKRPILCPWCNAEVTVHGVIVLCPKHGSEPFESKHE